MRKNPIALPGRLREAERPPRDAANEQPSADVRGIGCQEKRHPGRFALILRRTHPSDEPRPQAFVVPNFVAYVGGDARISRTIVPSMAPGSSFRGNLR